MIIQIRGLEPNIELTLDLKNLKDSDNESLLGIGTLYDPIPADSFILKTKTEIPTYYKGQTITVKWNADMTGVPDTTVDLICCQIKNIGRTFNEAVDKPINPWERVFKLSDKELTTPDGLLYLYPTPISSPSGESEFSLEVINNDLSEDTYMSYNIVFSVTYTTDAGLVRCQYFVVDPLLKVSSGVPPHN